MNWREKKSKIRKYVPPIGMRLIKTGIAVFLCFLVNMLRGDADVVFYSHIAAIYCMQDSVTETKKNAVNRAVATTVGALYGLVTLLLFPSLAVETMSERLVHGIVISAMVIFVVYTTVLIKQRDTAYFANVVYLSIVINNITNNPFLFTWNRYLDTLIGIVIALAVNSFRLPRERRRNILFVAELEKALLDKEKKLSGFSRVELNRMISAGAKITVSTTHTPGGLAKLLKEEVKLNCPVIVMDGAALYDMQEQRYVRSYVMSHSKAKEVMEFLRANGRNWFTHVIVDDMLITYYQKTDDAVYNQLVEELRILLHHNYVLRELPEGEDVVCLRMIDRAERIETLYQEIEKEDLQLKVVKYDAENVPGSAFLEIYNHDAVKENMISYLSQMLEVEEVVTLGGAEENSTYIIPPEDTNQTVRLIRKKFEPLKGFRGRQKETGGK